MPSVQSQAGRPESERTFKNEAEHCDDVRVRLMMTRSEPFPVTPPPYFYALAVLNKIRAPMLKLGQGCQRRKKNEIEEVNRRATLCPAGIEAGTGLLPLTRTKLSLCSQLFFFSYRQ